MTNLLIAVDGPSGSGKGSLCQSLIHHYGLSYLDTGVLYRAAGLLAKEAGVAFEDLDALVAAAKKITPEFINRRQDDLRLESTGSHASRIAVIPQVREAINEVIQTFIKDNYRQGVILDGRDIGTVVAPNADLKFYLLASQQIRAQRRYLELHSKGKKVTYNEILALMQRRDDRDSNRDQAPLMAASDAIVIDTTDLDLSGVVDRAKKYVDEFLEKRAITSQS